MANDDVARDCNGRLVPDNEAPLDAVERHLGYVKESVGELPHTSPIHRALGHLWYAAQATLRHLRAAAPEAKAPKPYAHTCAENPQAVCVACEAKDEATTGGMPDVLPAGTRYTKGGRGGYLPCDARLDRVMNCYRWETTDGRDTFHWNVDAADIDWSTVTPPPARESACPTCKAPLSVVAQIGHAKSECEDGPARYMREAASEKCEACGGRGRKTVRAQDGTSVQRYSVTCDDCHGSGDRPNSETSNAERSKRFNDTTGALTWNRRSAAEHPDRCECQDEVTPHKHYDEAPFACARCKCEVYRPHDAKTESKPGETAGPERPTRTELRETYFANAPKDIGKVSQVGLEAVADLAIRWARSRPAPQSHVELPTDPEDERIVDGLVARRAAGLKATRLVPQSPVELTDEEIEALEWCVEITDGKALTTRGRDKVGVAESALRKLNARAGVEEEETK